MENHPTPTVIIHNAQSQSWLSFRNPIAILSAQTPDQVLPLLETLQQQIDQHQLYAAGFVSYEASPAFDPVLKVNPTTFPLAWFGLYSKPEVITLPKPITSQPLRWTPSISQSQYRQAFDQVKNYIRQGNTYQVNLSFRLTAGFQQDPWHYFTHLIQAQNGRYGAFIETADWAICCASPELFFRQDGNEIQCRPMKGTVARGLSFEGDRHLAQWLKTSAKNQAENVMIVDMIRNDLGRIAHLGSVKVSSLFDLEQYPTLWQMTSSVHCTTDANLSQIFQALFPCASITGAPKTRTMEIIAELEDTPRKIYTGTIGFVTPERTSQFNVAIRTVLIDKAQKTAEYGVGGGIVWDSQAGDEFEECCTKAKILTAPQPDFSLLETLLWTPEEGYFLLDLHLERLAKSAQYFAVPFSLSSLRDRLKEITSTQRWSEQSRLLPVSEAVRRIPPPKSPILGDFEVGLVRKSPKLGGWGASVRIFETSQINSQQQKVRILVSQQGETSLETTPLDQQNQPLNVCLAPLPIDSSHVFLYHKTTHRQVYEQARQACPDYDDVILWNGNGELTESCIGNLVVAIAGQWYTPPVSCGLLAGTYRAWLLEQGVIQERVIRVKELADCSQIFLVNSVRGKREAVLGNAIVTRDRQNSLRSK
jgi:para-aminobenzoate synthetase / 4-amino-4-deoxychorismate lyase